MGNQPAPGSRRKWWVLGGMAFVAMVAVAAVGNSNTQISAAPQPQTQIQTQTASVVRQIDPPAPQPQVQPRQQQQQQNTSSNDNYYVNSDGNTVRSPAYSNSGVPAGATAQCWDGTYSFSQHRGGTCSYHGGVIQWLQ